MRSMKRSLLILALFCILIAAGYYAREHWQGSEIAELLNYEVVSPFTYKISLFDQNVGQITRIRITPDGNTMFAATLAENIHVYRKVNGKFVKQDKPFFSLATNLPGFPPEESGLSGLVLGADFEASGDVFLLYAANIGSEEKPRLKNHITRIRVVERTDGLFGEDPVLIWEGETDSAPSHQIQGGVGVMIQNIPHLIVNVGDAVRGDLSHDLSKDIGKVLLMQRNGEDPVPVGERPFPASPKVQAVGLRNAFDIAINPFDPLRRFAIGDTGTDRFDRFIYGALINFKGNTAGADLQWDGTNASLEKAVPDANVSGTPDMILHRWDPTETVTDIVFLEGGRGNLPKSNADTSSVLVSIFGKTGSTEKTPGKEIMLGRLLTGNAPQLELFPFIRRSEAGRGSVGHPLGLAVDPVSGTVYFGDILEGNMYQADPI